MSGEHSQRGAYVTDQVSLWIQNDSQHIAEARANVRHGGTRAVEQFLTRVLIHAQPGEAAWHVKQELAPNDYGRVDWSRVAREIGTEE